MSKNKKNKKTQLPEGVPDLDRTLDGKEREQERMNLRRYENQLEALQLNMQQARNQIDSLKIRIDTEQMQHADLEKRIEIGKKIVNGVKLKDALPDDDAQLVAWKEAMGISTKKPQVKSQDNVEGGENAEKENANDNAVA